MMRVHGPGDVGRRVAWRRKELGLSRTELADRAGMAESYITYLEQRPDTVTPQTLVRLGRALDTTPEALLGGDVLVPPGAGRAAPGARLVPLDDDECRRLLAPGGIGRIGFCTSNGPMVLPVNFGLAPEGIVFRTAPGSVLARQAGRLVAVEVDGVDEVLSEGWSVLAVGPARLVTDEAEMHLIAEWTGVQSWAGAHRDTYMCVAPDRITGRMIRTD